MKNWIAALIIVTGGHQAFCQETSFEVGMGYAYSAPISTMKQHVRHGDGLTMNFLVTPGSINRFSFGVDLNYTIYGHDKTRQQYTFDDGTVAPMDIIVNNYFINLMGTGRYFLSAKENANIRPYVNLKAGYASFMTDLNIYDPDEMDHCEPVDRDVLLKDGTFVFSGGGGLQWDLSSVFKGLRNDIFLFDVSINLNMGGNVKYMNTDPPSGNTHVHDNNAVHARFINNQTQVVHAHHVGYVESSYVEMVEIRGGFVFRISHWSR